MAYRLALATLGATCVLILLGGLVTNTGAALAVPDWPSTFGYNMVLFPWSRMVGGVFYEHSHRLMGALVGLLTLALGGALWREGGRLRRLGLLAVAVVLAQGVLGGLRVVLLEDALAILHGSLAPAFFALLAAIALLTAPRGRVAGARVEPALKGLTVPAAALVYAQIVAGALLTHAGRIALHWSRTGSLAFGDMSQYAGSAPFALILIAFLVNAAVPPLGAWLPDAYPEATATGAVFLTAFTTKSAVYALVRGYAGTEVLVWEMHGRIQGW